MALSLKISLDGGKVVKTVQFDPSTTVYDACRIIREKNADTCVGEGKDYGLFLISDEEAKKGIWLEPSRTLDYYILRNGDVLEYNKKIRNLRVRMLDGTVKTLLVDDSQVVANLMVVICTKIGITNYDEYGLVREELKEEPDPCEKPNYGTLTLKRKHQEKERDVKMDQLRKKLRTDDEVNWVEPSKTLREQGIDVTETLLLRRKFFFSDRNVDSRDPVQLNLLYVQARDAILDGTHPVTQDKACEFAGLQCQIQFGDHKEDKHTTGFLDLKEFLPASYVKVKGVEKKVFKEHKKHIGVTELDSKVMYTKGARSLKTYGVAFFLVKEKMKGKNKLVPRLLGVTKDSVLRLDEKTKEILQSWPLTTVRRWCASPNTFTLDFGDYSDQYYSVQTTEAEQILQVIAGYIDIILKKQRAKDHLGIEGDEGSAMIEDSVSPSKANIIQHDTFKSAQVNTESVAKPAVLRPGAEGAKSFAVGHLTGAQQTTVSGQIITGHTSPAASQIQQTRITSVMSEPQRALVSTITTGREIIKQTEMDLTRASVPELGHDAASLKWKQVTLDTNKQQVTSHIAAMNAATAQVVTLTSGPTEEVDHTAVGAAITTITSNLPEMTKGVQMIAALMDDTDNGDRLLDATRKLCSAFSDLLKAAEPETKEPRQSLLNAASRVGEASTSVLHTIGEETQYDKETQDILLSLAKAVANTTAALVLKAKGVAAQCKAKEPTQAAIIAAATHCALATSQLVACTKVVAPTLHNAACREQLADAARQVAIAVERLLAACAHAPDPATVEDLTAAAHRVTEALERLLAHTQFERRAQPTVTETSVETVMTATERLVTAPDTTEMVKQARLLGQATAHLINNIKTEAEKQPSETQRKLMAAAKLLADATARMVEAARQCASSPQDRTKQDALRKAAEELRYITVDYAQGQDIVGTQFARLQDTAKQAASSATQLITSAQNASVHNTNKYSQETLMQECHPLLECVPRVVEAVQVSSLRSGEAGAQLDLISASEALLQPSGHVIAASRAVLPTVTDAASAKHLADTTHEFTTSCTELRSAVNRARISCKGLELDAAAEIIRSLQAELDEVEEAARAFQLKPLPGQTAEWASSTMTSGQRSAASATAQLVSSARHGESAGAGRAATDLASSLKSFSSGLRASVAVYPEREHSDRLVSSGRHVLESSQLLVETVKRYMTTSEQVDTTRITNIAKNITQSMERTMQAVPSHRELDLVSENINETLNILNMGEFPPTNRSYGQLQTELCAAATELNSASASLTEAVQSAERPAALAESGRAFGDSLNRLLGVGMEMAGQTEDRETQSMMVTSMKSVTVNSSKLVGTAKSVSQDLSRPNAKNQLNAAARAVTDSINRLVDVCTEAAPGQKECNKAIMSIRGMKPLLQNPTQPVSELGYFACLDAVVDQSKGLSEGMSGMASAAKRSAHEQFAKSVNTVAESICGLVESTAQAAYLVAISDESSTAGRPGLVDQAQFSRAALAIDQACRTLADPDTNQQQVLSAATVIAKHTSALCNACRVASGKTAEPQPKRHFVQAAKDVANSTAALVKEIKALDQDYSESNRARCASATVPLQDAVRSLCQFADSPEFAAVPARISAQAKRSQEAILECGRSIISASCSMIESAKVLAVQPTDKPQWQALATHSKTVSDSIKSLVNNIREKAPGQRECLAGVETVNGQLRELDRVAISAVSQDLQPRKLNTLQGYSEQIENSATEILERIEPLRVAAKHEAENLGHAVLQLVSYVEPLVQASIGAASNITESRTQAEILDRTKTVLEGLAQLLLAAKDSGGNPRATSVHPEVEEQASGARAALSELIAGVRAVSSQHGAVGGLLDSLSRSVARLTQHRMSLIGSFDETDSFVDYQTRMVGAAKEIAMLATDMSAKSTTDVNRLVPLGSDMCIKYEQLAQDAVGAAAVTPNTDVAHRLRTCVVQLGESVSELVKAGGHCRLSSTAHNQRAVAEKANGVNEKVASVLAALQAGSRGTQACIDAASKIAAIIGDLDTTILFASAGTLHSESESASFSDHRENILKTAKNLVEDTKTLVGGAAGSQDQLASAAQSAVTTIVQLAEVVKLGAMSLGSSNPEPQVMLLHAARDVASALRDLTHATKGASGKQVAHPDMDKLKQSAKRLTDATKRWSLPAKSNTTPRQNRRRSMNVALRHDNGSCDSETDIFVSDQEEELLKLFDYSSQDDEISPSIFYDNCEEVVAYIERVMADPTKIYYKDDDIDDRYNIAARNSLTSMDWRVLKYGENIFLGEVKKFIDVVVDLAKRTDIEKKNNKIIRRKANDDLDSEMNRLSRVIEDLDSEMEKDELVKEVTTTTIRTIQTSIPTKRIKVEEKPRVLSSPVFKVRKVRPVNLVVNLDINNSLYEKATEPNKDNDPQETQKGEATPIVVETEVIAKEPVKSEFWKQFTDDSEWWKGLAKRNLENLEHTRRELARFSGHELVLADYDTDFNNYSKEKEALESFIEDVDRSKSINMDLEYDEKYEEMILKLINFAKRDFNYKGFDPLIEQLKSLSNEKLERRKKHVNINDIINIYSRIDITQYSYEELCLLEKYYKEIIRKYKHIHEKENLHPREDRETKSASPSYHRNVILNIRSSEDTVKNKYHHTVTFGGSLDRSKAKKHKTERNTDILDLTRTYPMEYYANNWWSIYEDILKSREKQYGSLGNWWNFYEAVLSKEATDDQELNRIRAVVRYRSDLRGTPTRRAQEQLRMLDEVENNRFNETEETSANHDDSVMVTNVTSLLKTVKAVEDEHTRGLRALESTIEAISQEVGVLMSPAAPKMSATPEELVRRTRQMTVATARAVAAGNAAQQDLLIAAANLGRRTVLDLLAACKAAAHSAESHDLRERTLLAGRDAAESYRALLQAVLAAANGDAAASRQLPELSRRVAQSVADIIAAAEMLKGPDWVDPADPTVIAETELLGAAASIDAAAKKLDALRPRKSVKVQEADESLNFDEMILEAAKSIIAASSALVRAASASQRELIDQGKVARRPISSSDDGQWSEGLISAARLVAAAAHALAEAANSLVLGHGSEERLVSSAQHVAFCTAQLLVACKVKADPTSESTRRLQLAGAEVIRSTENLVRAARNAISCEEERSLVLNRKMVGGIAQEIDARSDILRIEKELEEARGRLNAIRQAKYKLRTGETSGDETDTDVYVGGYTSDSSAQQHRFKNTSLNTSSFGPNTTYSPNSSYTPHNTNTSQAIQQLNQSIHGYGSTAPNYSPSAQNYSPSAQSAQNYSPGPQNYSPGAQNYTAGAQSYSKTTQSNGTIAPPKSPVQSPTFSSFRPKPETPKQNYEGFTTRKNTSTKDRTTNNPHSVEVRAPTEVRVAYLVTSRDKPQPPPRRVSLLKLPDTHYETRLYEAPKAIEERRHHEISQSQHHTKQENVYGYDTPKVPPPPKLTCPLSPKFNARDLKFDDAKAEFFSSLRQPTAFSDGVGQNFCETQRSTEVIPGGTRQSEFTVKSESYSSGPKTEFSKLETKEIKSPFTTSTPNKYDKSEYNQYSQQSYGQNTSTDLVKVATPDYSDRISSPYGKEVYSYGGPDYRQETMTEVKEIPNGTQKVTTTKIYSSSPVTMTSTNTKYEPKIELDESRFSTLDSKSSIDNRSFLRPSDFHTSDYQASTNIAKIKKPADLTKEFDSMDQKFSKQTMTSQTIERKSVMTSSHKSETSSTVTKKFGNV